jgi:glycosyltransferase involved in cell wall biosynthesis
MKLLFISHEASRTGAPILLLRLIKLIMEKGEVECEVLVKKDGPLVAEFKKIAPTACLEVDTWLTGPWDIKGRIRRIVNLKKIRKSIASSDIVFSNTITNGDLDYLIGQHPNIITYVHELEKVIALETQSNDLKAVLRHSKRFLYVSNAVKDNLEKSLGVSPTKLFRLNGFIPDSYYRKTAERTKMRERMSIGESQYLVCGMGTNDWRKGVDLFVKAAHQVLCNRKDVFFYWVGSRLDSSGHKEQSAIIESLGIAENVFLLPPVDDAMSYLLASDVFFLSSREDPYPLVMIESAMMKLPIVYFTNAGGADEFLGDDAGIGVDHLDTALAASEIERLIENPLLRSSLGEMGRNRYEASHQMDAVYRSFLEVSLGRSPEEK